MTSVFFSYKRNDPLYSDTIESIFTALEEEGFGLFRDKDDILPGELWRHRIGKALQECICGVTLWSPAAAQSPITRAEARYLMRQNKLIPVALDPNSVPREFQAVQYAVLGGFDGDRNSDQWQALSQAIWQRLSPTSPAVLSPARSAMRDLEQAMGISSDEVEIPDPRTEDEPQSGIFRDASDLPLMVRIPAGAFVAGSDDPKARENEGPAVQVEVESSFALSVTPITNRDWNLAAQSGARGVSPKDETQAHLSYPVTNVSWRESKRYIAWLNARVNDTVYELPSEAEWEYAASSGGKEAYGTDQLPVNLQQVGAGAGNAFGLHDACGLVWQWTEDEYAPTHAGMSRTAQPRVKTNSSWRTIRGGSTLATQRQKTIRARTGLDETFQRDDLGFRVKRRFKRMSE